MSRIVAQFDPSTGGGDFSAAAVNRCSALFFMNESPNFIALDFGGAMPSTIIQPWSNRLIRLRNPVQTVNWTVAATLQSGSAPASMVYVEAFDPNEDLSGVISGPLFRQSNVGNAAAVASATSSVQNDANPPATTVVEATPSDQASSSLSLKNDASGFIQVLSANALRKVLNVVRGNATTGKAQVTLGDSADPSITTLYGQLGTLSSDGGKITSDGAGNLSANSLKTGALLAATAAAHFFIESLQSGATALGIAFTTWTGSGSATPFSIGGQIGGAAAYVDNSGNLHAPTINGLGASPFDVTANGHTTSFNADGTITTSPKTFTGTVAVLGSGGGGAAGVLIWQGTTDPGAAAGEGDAWLPA